MSLEAMTWAFKRTLRPAAKVVLLAIADYADDTGVCWPSQKTLAEKASMTPRGVRQVIRELEEIGLLVTEKRDRPNGSQASNSYRLQMGGEERGSAPGGNGGSSLEPSYRTDLTKTSPSQSRLIAGSDSTDSELSEVQRAMLARSGITALSRIIDLVRLHCDRVLTAREAIVVTHHILSKSKSMPHAPQRYVQGAIVRSPAEIQQFIDESGMGNQP